MCGACVPPDTCGGGGKHGGSQCAGLFGAVNTDRHIHGVGHHLHDKGRLSGYSAESDQSFYGDAFFTETVYDRFSSEAGGFDDSPEHFGGITSQAETCNNAF